MKKTLSMVMLGLASLFSIGGQAEDMSAPGHPGYVAAEGNGCLVWSFVPCAGETVTWSGPCLGNKASGSGNLVWRCGQATETYAGEMRVGKSSGHGAYVWADGRRYDGEWADGDMNGRGTFTWANEGPNDPKSYEGSFQEGRFVGPGKVIWANADRYEGGIAGGTDEPMTFKPDGRGQMTKTNGDWYDGEWSGGYADGEGKASINGKKYSGVWARGCLRSTEQRAAWDVPRHECP